jgi:hypothetical protein
MAMENEEEVAGDELLDIEDSIPPIGIRELEDLFNEQLIDTIKTLRCQHLKLVRGWVIFDESVNSPVLNVQSGNVVNVYLKLSNFSDLWAKNTWRMIKDVLDKADKNRLQKSMSLLDVRKFVDAKVQLHKKSGYTAKVRTLENATDQNAIMESIIELLPDNCYVVKVKRTSVVLVQSKNNPKLRYKVEVDSKFEEQAIYEGKIDVARQLLDSD